MNDDILKMLGGEAEYQNLVGFANFVNNVRRMPPGRVTLFARVLSEIMELPEAARDPALKWIADNGLDSWGNYRTKAK